MLAQLATLIYNTADTYFVSLTKNADQIAAVTLSTPILLIIMSIACIFGMGGSSVIARLLGEDNKEDSCLCFQFATWAILTFGVIVTVLGMLCVPISCAHPSGHRGRHHWQRSEYYLWCVFSQKRKGNNTVSASPKGLLKSGKIAGSVVKIGVPGAMITVLLSVSNIVLNSHVAGYGSDVVACYGIAYKLSLFAVLLSVGLAQGIAPLFGFCYGAKQMDRLRRSVYIGAAFDILLGVFFAAAFALFGRVLTAFFLDDGKLIAQSASFLGVIGLSAPLVGVSIILYFLNQKSSAA